MVQHDKGIFMEYVDDDEVLLGTIHKHPFGIIIIYLQAIVGIILSLFLAFVLLPTVLSSESAITVATTFGALIIMLAAVIMIVATIIYRQSRIVITDKNITQVLQGGLFNRKVSQLTMANVEDVTAEQHGIFSTILDYGNLRVETAGEQANFVFSYCPRAGYYAKIILEAREKFISHDFPYAGAYRGQVNPMATLSPRQAEAAQQAAQQVAKEQKR